ncbi:Thiol-disulfide isomerase or thioredoxin [Oceanospirillum multiglobuliferum]|uniref:Thioredoxin domain-containing protein n=1 Tax=Oceanospirillum multiglobuliferum TaxID=64969 RepID=A0A1T4KWN1_9GAMM|nr:thioredoxin family protein [Oceanospirillum multiglobuliferum]OPX54982.1 hypothetical protein BTE48_11630 [Oceanospirillum multiglobuliferum]SJZ46780.1 Thiol-disulfide isomerase or thioredoxin [Oceanospirillum multiglobuliferum]
MLITVDDLDQLPVSTGAVFVLFSTPDCGVCQSLKHKLPIWAATLSEQVQCYYVDLVQMPQACARYQVLTVPTLIFWLDGIELVRQQRHINFALLIEQLSRSVALWQSTTLSE